MTRKRPSLLVSFAYLREFRPEQLSFSEWVLDSGAFTAHSSGKPVELQAYIDKVKELRAGPCPPAEVFGLDVIGDWRASRRNAEAMRDAGIVDVIPAFHFGSPESELLSLSKSFPKIALGGVARKGMKVKQAFAKRCFSKVWPKRLHGFGYATEETVMMLPWHTVDASTWEMGPFAFGRWSSLGGKVWGVKTEDIRAEVDVYLRREAAAQSRWKRTMEQDLDGELAPKIRLAVISSGGSNKARRKALEA